MCVRFSLFLGFICTTEMLWASRHVIEIQAGIETVQGSYFFSTQPGRMRIMLPRENADFKFEHGGQDLSLSEQGFVEAEIQEELAAFSWVVPATSSGKATLTFDAPYYLERLVLLYPIEGDLELRSPMMNADVENVMGQKFRSLSMQNVAEGTMIQVEISGVPIGRSLYYRQGVYLGLVLVLVTLVWIGWFQKTTLDPFVKNVRTS